MKFTLIRDDSTVYIDGVSFSVPMTALPDQAIRAIQYESTVGGEIEYDNHINVPLTIADFDATFAPFVTLWNAAKAAASQPKTLTTSTVVPPTTGFKTV